MSASSRAFNTSYISREQRLISSGNKDLLNCFNGFNRLESVHFIDAYKKLGSNESQISELFSHLRRSPELLAKYLISFEKSNPESVEEISQIVLSSLYSNCILNDDKVFALNLMKSLISFELSITDNPRRLLRYNWCAFSHIYRMFCDQIFEAKPFLTAALYEPVMQLLAEDDLFLDIDPNRAAVRFPPSERIRHFGKEGTQLYYENLQKYRIWTINKLAAFVNKFVDGIHNNIFCFPQSLSWIIRQIYNTFIQNTRTNPGVREISAICTDLIFGFFICPAILSPDLLGITDAHVSHISRFNLQQIAQIIQMLALSKWEEIDPKLDDLYSKVSKEGITKLLEHIFEKRNNCLPQEHNNLQFITRSSILISESELKAFIRFIKSVNFESEDEMTKKFKEIIEKIGEKFLTETNEKVISNTSPENSPRNRRSILNRVTKSKSKSIESQLSSSTADNSSQSINKSNESQVIEVLVIPIGSSRECPGMLSEDKVLKTEQKKSTKVRMNFDLVLTQNNEETESVVSAISGSAVSGSEKRTRFSLSQDQESIGTSDNLEAISEAASNHSDESLSLGEDLENENDNMSDMVSANVSSGRATPNVSGRDTPSSHSPNQSSASSDEEPDGEQMVDPVVAPVDNPVPSVGSGLRRLNTIPITQPNRPNNRDDIEDKFGKFDIKPVAAVDETKSMLSDTWSTDVLGSDSEAFEQTENPSNIQPSAMNMFAGHPSHALQSILDSVETASQSDAWSTDVLTSDTERLQEFDPDDSASVTRSEPEEENFPNMYECNNPIESPKNGTIKPRNPKMSSNATNFGVNSPQDMTDSAITRPKTGVNSNMSSHKILIINKTETERNSSSSDTLVAENTDHFSESFPMSLSPNLLTHNMQSLGRLSFDVKKFEDDITVYSTLKPNGMTRDGSLVSELLSLDLTQQQNSPKMLSDSELKNILIDFDGEVSSETLTDQNQTDSQININSVNNNKSIDLLNEIEIQEKTQTVIITENESQISSGLSQIISNSNKTIVSITNQQMSGDSSGASTGAIPKVIKSNVNPSARFYHNSPNDDDPSRHTTNRKGFFKLSNIKSNFKEKFRSFKDKRVSSNDDSYDYEISRNNRMSLETNEQKNESSDDILAKYRAKGSLLTNSDESSHKTNITIDSMPEEDKNDSIDESELLNTTKKKLRKVLSSIDLITLPAVLSETIRNDNKTKVIEITNILKVCIFLLVFIDLI